MAEAEPLISRGVLLWVFLLLVPVAMITATLSALLERSGPIRLRHWAEEAGGSLRKLLETPVQFGVFRYVLSVLSRTLPIVLAALLTSDLTRFHRAHPMPWAFVAVLLLVGVAEIVNRTLVGQDPERSLRALTRVYRAALWLLSPLVRLLSPFIPAEAFERHEEGGRTRAPPTRRSRPSSTSAPARGSWNPRRASGSGGSSASATPRRAA